ncbi:MAG: hypothetical protein IM631_13145 [Cytophagales bacterium]|nr:hypothetical protein [Cytophagales bacterium]MCA6372319.1 hypothetical protein [Cytophagales bacterium]MCA6382465.1 hypothetical protein [Cytophagales bacterium]
MDFPYNANINKRLSISGFDFVELLMLLGATLSCLVASKIIGIVFPLIGTIVSYLALLVLGVGIPFLRYGNKQAYKGFLISFIGHLIQRKQLLFMYKDLFSRFPKKNS